MPKITKAVFPVAGLGTRFLPATKASPKEMLPVVDKPLIQYAVEEAVSAGIKEIIFITSHGKRAIEDHFDTNYELEETLLQQQKLDLYNTVKNILPEGVSCIYLRQGSPKGLGHAVSVAKNLISADEHFAVLLADDLIYHTTPCLTQMVQLYEKLQQSIVAVQSIDINKSSQYGIVDFDKDNNDISSNYLPLTSIVEKPKPVNAPSNLAVVGRYILSGKVFDYLDKTIPGKNNEIQLTDAILNLIEDKDYSGVCAYKFNGTRYDCGSKLGYLKATVEYGLRHPQLGYNFSDFLANLKEESLV